jgi:diacylglycerol kinase (ATP)
MPSPNTPDKESPFKSVGGPARLFKALGYSMSGFAHAFRFEAAFRQELALVLPFAVAAAFLPLPLIDKILLCALAGLVLIVELINSAIEAAVDRISLERHPLSGRAKDLGSAAVLLSISLFAISWLLLAGPLVWKLIVG